MVIHRRLMLEEARRRGIVVTDKELDDAIASLRRRFDDLEGFGAWMKEQGLDDRSLFEAVRADMLTDRVWASLVAGVRISDGRGAAVLRRERRDLVIGEEVRLRIIAVKDEAAAEEILAALRKGESFRRLARQRSLGVRAAQGGDTGWVDSRTLPEPLRKPVQLLKPGDVGGPLQRGPGEFLVIGLEGRRPIRARSLAEARPEIERQLLPVGAAGSRTGVADGAGSEVEDRGLHGGRAQPRQPGSVRGDAMAIARCTVVGMALLAGVAAAAQAPALKDEQAKRSYALGMAVGNQLRSESVEVDSDLYRQGLKDALSGGKTLLTEAESRAALHRLQLELKRAPQRDKLAAAAAAGGIEVSFKLDPRVTKSLYMGERWVSGPAFSSASVPEGETITVEARARRPSAGAAGKIGPDMDRVRSRDGDDNAGAGR